jgi:hypothetical protein
MIKVTFEDCRLAEYLEEDVFKSSLYPFIDQPNFSFNDRFHAFNENLHSWFVDNAISYSFANALYYYTTLIFEKESDAVLFKLTWL